MSVVESLGSSTLATMHVLAGISWEPEIRGALVVLVGSTVLMGSVWLLLTTNMGHRLGSLNAAAGFFGWMAIMGAVWWIYGFGLQGDRPIWEPTNIVYGDLAGSDESDVRDLDDANIVVDEPRAIVDRYCPGLVDATVQVQRARYVNEDIGLELLTPAQVAEREAIDPAYDVGDSVVYDAPEPYCNEQVGEAFAVDPETIADETRLANQRLLDDAAEQGITDNRALDEDELEEAVAVAIDEQNRRRAQVTLSGLAALSGEIIDDAKADKVLDFNGWRLLSSSEAGEASAAADAFLRGDPAAAEANFGDGGFIVLDALETGGKPTRDSDGVFDRVKNELQNTIKFWHPRKLVVVQVAPTLDKPQIEGAPPPFPEADPDGQIVSVVMERNLGTLRLPPAITTIGSLIAFLGLCLMLHRRDVELRRRVDEWDPDAATS